MLLPVSSFLPTLLLMSLDTQDDMVKGHPRWHGTSRPKATVTYGQGMPRPPKDFADPIVEISQPSPPPATIRASHSTEVPEQFVANVAFEDSPLVLELGVLVSVGAQARAVRVTVKSTDGSGVTTTMLRKIPIEHVLKAALASAERPMTPRPDLGPDAWQPIKKDGSPSPFIRMQQDSLPASTPREQRQRDHVRRAAAIYAAAVADGSRAPGEAVALQMGYSRSQAARFIRLARSEKYGLLPKIDDETAHSGTSDSDSR